MMPCENHKYHVRRVEKVPHEFHVIRFGVTRAGHAAIPEHSNVSVVLRVIAV